MLPPLTTVRTDFAATGQAFHLQLLLSRIDGSAKPGSITSSRSGSSYAAARAPRQGAVTRGRPPGGSARRGGGVRIAPGPRQYERRLLGRADPLRSLGSARRPQGPDDGRRP